MKYLGLLEFIYYITFFMLPSINKKSPSLLPLTSEISTATKPNTFTFPRNTPVPFSAQKGEAPLIKSNPFTSRLGEQRTSRSGKSNPLRIMPATYEQGQELEMLYRQTSSSSQSKANISLEETAITRPVFNSYDVLKNTAHSLGSIFTLESPIELNPSITAFYNPSQKRLLIPKTTNSHIEKLAESLSPHFNYFLVIGDEKISTSNIVFLEKPSSQKVKPTITPFNESESAIFKLKQKRLEGNPAKETNSHEIITLDFYNEGHIELTDKKLYQKPLNSFGNKWVPVMVSTEKQSSRKGSYINPDIHLFDDILINEGIAKEYVTLNGVVVPLENYSTHAYLNPLYLVDRFPFKLTKFLFSKISHIELFTQEVAIRESSLSQGARSVLVKLNVAAEFRVDKKGPIKTLFINKSSQLAKFLKESKDVMIKLAGNTLPFEYSDNKDFLLGKTLSYIVESSLSVSDKTLTQINPWSIHSVLKRGSIEYLSSSKTEGIIAVLEYSPNFEYPGLVDTFYPVLKDFKIYIESNLISRSKFITKILPEGNVSKVVSFITSKKPTPGLNFITNPSQPFTLDPFSVILEKTSSLPIEALGYNLKLSPVFKDFSELSFLAEHLFLNISRLEPSEGSFVRINPLALYHPRKNEVALLKESFLGNLYKNFQRRPLTTTKAIKFTNNFKSPTVSLYEAEDFQNLLQGIDLVSSLETSSFEQSSYQLYSDRWNILLISLTDYFHKSPEPIALSLFKEVSLFKSFFTKQLQYLDRDFSYEILSKSWTKLSFPLFNSHEDLLSAVNALKPILPISDKATLNISALYNSSTKSVILSNSKDSYLSNLFKSLIGSKDEVFLIIGDTEIHPDDIIFSQTDPLTDILSKNRYSLNKRALLLNDDKLFSTPLEFHGDKWIPIMLSLNEQSSQGTTSRVILPEIHIFDLVSINGGLAKEVLPANGVLNKLTLENYTKHLIMNHKFSESSGFSTIKIPKSIFSTNYEIELYTSELSITQQNLTHGAKPHLGSLIPSGFIEYSPTGIKPKLLVLEDTNLANFIKSNSDSFFRLSDSRLDVEFLTQEHKSSLELSTANMSSSQGGKFGVNFDKWFSYSFKLLERLKDKGDQISSILITTHLEHSKSTTNTLLSSLSFPIYPVFEDLYLVSTGVHNQSINLSTNIAGIQQVKKVPFLTRAKWDASADLLNTIRPSTRDLLHTDAPKLRLTSIFKDFNELSIIAEKEIKNISHSYSISKKLPFVEINPTAIYQLSSGKIGILEGSTIGSFHKQKNILALTEKTFEFTEPLFLPRIEFFSKEEFLKLLKHKPLAYFMSTNTSIEFKTPLEASADKWFPILAQMSYDGETIFLPYHAIRLFKELKVFGSNQDWLIHLYHTYDNPFF